VPELSFAVTVSRDLLALADLDINDHLTYYVSPQFLGGQVQWSRQQATSPFVDGSVTVSRFRQTVTEQIAIEVLAGTGAGLKANVDTLIDAFMQDSFILTVVSDGATYAYTCEAADYQLAWTGPRMIGHQAQVVLSVPRSPVALAGTA
jgi:hypothetical protein